MLFAWSGNSPPIELKHCCQHRITRNCDICKEKSRLLGNALLKFNLLTASLLPDFDLVLADSAALGALGNTPEHESRDNLLGSRNDLDELKAIAGRCVMSIDSLLENSDKVRVLHIGNWLSTSAAASLARHGYK